MARTALQAPETQSYPTIEEVNQNRLLDACVHAVDQYGLRDLQMSHVIEASGLSRRTTYKYFKNKSALVNAAYLREAIRLFEGARKEVSACSTVEDIFVYSFLYIYQHLPENPLMRELIDHNQELVKNLDVKKNLEDVVTGLAPGSILMKNQNIKRDMVSLSEYWVQVILSFLLMRSGENKSLADIEAYVRKRFVPGLCLDEYTE
ncbi:MAG TPA: TetR/AcrR family transcriptional regulator [Pseudomonadales bacterium]|nr:TetR/AcrR family transcriptional regulator [Pseudomonadales bacterium]